MTKELILKDEVYTVIGAAFEVSNELGSGFLEPVYQEALEIEFEERNIPFFAQPRAEIHYKNRILKKEYIPDFLCFDELIVEIKALKEITGIEESQVLNYLKATKKPLALLINFGAPKLEWRRLAYTRQKIIRE